MTEIAPTRRQLFVELGLATILYGVLTFLLLYPIFASPATSFDPSDLPSRWRHAPLQDVFSWAASWSSAEPFRAIALPDAGVQFPSARALAVNQRVLGHLPTFAPALAWSGDPVTATQFDSFLSFALCGGGAFLLLRFLGVSTGAAFLGGVLYAFCPIRIGFLADPAHLPGQYLPLAMVCLSATIDRGRASWALGAGVFLVAQLLCSSAYLTAVLPAALAYVTVYGVGRRPQWRPLLLALSAIGFAWLVGMFLTRSAAIEVASGRFVPTTAPELVRMFSLQWGGLLTSPVAHAPWSNGPTGAGNLGAASLLLVATAGIGATRSGPQVRGIRAFFAFAAVCWIGALGSRASLLGAPVLYDLIAATAPSRELIAPPFQLTMVLALGWACLAAFGLDTLIRRWRSPALRVAALVAAVAFFTWETGLAAGPVPTLQRRNGPTLPEVYRALEELPRGPMVELPITERRREIRASIAESMMHSVYHRQPLILAVTDLRPALAEQTLEGIRDLPSPSSLEWLEKNVGLRYVVVHLDRLDTAQRRVWRNPPGLHLSGIYEQKLLFEVRRPGLDD